MRVLYVAMAFDYGDPARGPSFEEMNFRSALEGMGHELFPFDFMSVEADVGRQEMNRRLVRAAADIRPDLAFFFLYEDQIARETIRSVSREGRTITMNWFADDHWRFDEFTRHYAPSFDWSVTTDPDALVGYRDIGIDRVILSQWAVNRYAYGRTATGLAHEVTFVGMPHGARRATLEGLREQGIEVECYGAGWPRGRVSHEQMVEIFGSSRINLNLSNSSTFEPRTLRERLGAIVKGTPAPRPSQIKGRTFEVPGCGGFLLTERVPHLERYFEVGSEIAVFEKSSELGGAIREWLADEERRASVAEAGWKRVMAEHTYDHRFAAIFCEAGLA